MDKIKKGLGRGLSSLIGETKVVTQKNQLSVSDLVPNKYGNMHQLFQGQAQTSQYN